MTTKRVWFLVPLICLLTLCGCLEFEKQTLTYSYDAGTDTLRIYQDYQGIFGADKKDGLSEEEQGQLKSVLTGGRTFFFANWIFEYNREELEKELVELKNPQEGDGPRMNAEMIGRMEALIKLALENVTVENGPFYSGDGGKLCAVQQVTVKQFSKLVAAGNATIRDYYRMEATNEKRSVEERELDRTSSSRVPEYLRIDGNQWRVRLPMSQADYDKAFGPASDSFKQIEEFRRSGGKLDFTNNEMTLVVGEPKARRVRLTLPMSKQEYSPNTVAAVKERTTVLPKFDVAAAAEKFFGEGK